MAKSMSTSQTTPTERVARLRGPDADHLYLEILTDGKPDCYTPLPREIAIELCRVLTAAVNENSDMEFPTGSLNPRIPATLHFSVEAARQLSEELLKYIAIGKATL